MTPSELKTWVENEPTSTCGNFAPRKPLLGYEVETISAAGSNLLRDLGQKTATLFVQLGYRALAIDLPHSMNP
jgi:hypothetical protein